MKRLHFCLRVLKIFHPERWKIARLLGVIALAILAGLAAVWPLALLVDNVLMPGRGGGPIRDLLPISLQDSPVAHIIVLASLVFLLRITQELLGAWRDLLNARIGQAGVLRVRSGLFQQLQQLSLLFHRTQPQGDTIVRLTRDAGGCHQVLNVGIEVLVALLTLTVILVIMIQRSAMLTLVALAVVPLLLVTNVVFGQVLQKRSRLARDAESTFTSVVGRAISTVHLTQAFGRQRDEHQRFSARSVSSMDAWYALQWRFTLYRICIGVIFGAGAAGIFGFGGWMAWRDQVQGVDAAGMTAGNLVVFLAYLAMLYDPLCKLTGAGANMIEGVTGMERVFEILDQKAAIADAPDAQPLPVQPRTLTINNLSFAYSPSKPVLRNLDLTIKAGEMVAFVGGSGVGKSTLLYLLCRFFDPNSGALAIDGQDFRSIRLDDLRRHVAIVFQEGLTLPTTIAENIGYGRPEATAADIRAAAKMAGADDFIDALPDGYATVITENGHNLSGGQRQRIAIARALLTGAPIIVLDEPTSALDAECEALVTQTLRSLKGTRTIVLVSHRLSTVVHADRIIVMHEGRSIAAGSHDELMVQPGWYSHAVRRQSPEETAVAVN